MMMNPMGPESVKTSKHIQDGEDPSTQSHTQPVAKHFNQCFFFWGLQKYLKNGLEIPGTPKNQLNFGCLFKTTIFSFVNIWEPSSNWIEPTIYKWLAASRPCDRRSAAKWLANGDGLGGVLALHAVLRVLFWNKFKLSVVGKGKTDNWEQIQARNNCSFFLLVFFGEKIVHLLLCRSNTTQPQPSCWWSHGVSHRRCANKDERMQRENANLNAETGFGIFLGGFFKQNLQRNPNIHLWFEKNLTHFLFFGGGAYFSLLEFFVWCFRG